MIYKKEQVWTKIRRLPDKFSMPPAIEISSLIKKFGNIHALDGVSFNIDEGEFFGLLGPNGAGKTTLIRILTTLIKPTSGRAKIMDIDVVKKPGEVRKKIGVVPQAMTTDLDLTGMENMDIYAQFYSMPKKERQERINHLLELVGLKERANELVATYSGGMRRRLEIARGLVHKPAILILDEPTLGLDPQSRHVVWELLQRFCKGDKLTILLTTHYMEEAEALCSKVAIIDYGKIVALDTVEGLKKDIPQKDVVELTVSGAVADAAIQEIKGIPFVHTAVITDNVMRVSVDNGAQAIPHLVNVLKNLGVDIQSVTLKKPTLEDVFIHFTGRPIREEEVKKVSYLIGAGIPSKWGR